MTNTPRKLCSKRGCIKYAMSTGKCSKHHNVHRIKYGLKRVYRYRDKNGRYARRSIDVSYIPSPGSNDLLAPMDV